MAEESVEDGRPGRVGDYLRLVATLPVAGLGALAVSRLLRPSFCTLHQQLRVWSAAFLFLLSVLVFTLELRRFGDVRSAAIRTAVVVLVLRLLLSISVPNTFGAVNRSRQIGTRVDLRTIAEAMEAVRKRLGAYPSVSSVGGLESLVHASLPQRDRWGNPFWLRSEPTRCVVVSFGECGEPDQADPWSYSPGTTDDLRADMVFLNGKAWRYPEGAQHD